MALFFSYASVFCSFGNNFSIGKGGFKEFSVKKSKGFLIPYALLSLALWVLLYPSRIIQSGFKLRYLKGLLGIAIGYRHTQYYFSMWFILALFVAELLLFFVLKLIDNKKLWQKNIVLFASVILSVLIGFVIISHINGFIWSLDLAPFAYAFLAFGYIIKLNIEIFYKLSKIYFLPLLLICNIALTYFNYTKSSYMVDLYNGKVGNIIYYFFASVFGLCFVLSLCYVIKKCKPLEYIGKNTMIFYAFQNSLVIPFGKEITEYIFRAFNIEFNTPVMFIIIMIISVLLLSAMSEIINRYMPVLIGKNLQNKAR